MTELNLIKVYIEIPIFGQTRSSYEESLRAAESIIKNKYSDKVLFRLEPKLDINITDERDLMEIFIRKLSAIKKAEVAFFGPGWQKQGNISMLVDIAKMFDIETILY